MAKEAKEIPLTDSPRILAELGRIRSREVRRYNKYGEWVRQGMPGAPDWEIIDMRAVMK